MVEVVTEVNGELIFPPGIPSKRNTKNEPYTYTIILFLVVACYCASDYSNIYIYTVLSALVIILLEVQKRILSFFEEKNHLGSRYKKSYSRLLKAYDFNRGSIIVICFTLCLSIHVFCVLKIFNFSIITTNGDYVAFLLILGNVWNIMDIIGLSACSMTIARSLDQSLGLDYGSGVANSYFEGYLNIILPDFRDERKGFREMISNYEDQNNVEFGARKMYILIPLSGKCSPTLVNQSKIAEEAGKLESRKIHRAGTQDRVYHSSVYKLWVSEDQKPIYVCAEYATPMQTLNEAMNRNSLEAARYKEFYPELVTNFYMTLRKLVKRANYKHCELIYYKDTNDNGEFLEDLDVGKLILDRMNLLT